jgi:hypothetical protein
MPDERDARMKFNVAAEWKYALSLSAKLVMRRSGKVEGGFT